MNERNLYSYLFIWLFIGSLATHSLAQTITTGSVTPSSICPGGAVSVSFTISGTFAAGNKFSAQLSDAAGMFSASSTVIGSVTSTTASPINATISSATTNGTYKIRVVSSSPAVSSSISAPLTINVPSAPGTSSLSYCVGQTATALTASAAEGATLNWYGTNAMGGTASLVAPTPSTTAVSSTTYYVSQTQNGCESPRASLVVTVNSAPAAPTANTPAPYCQGATAAVLVASGLNLKWYDASSNLLNGAPMPSTNTPGSTTYYVSQSVGSCESSRTAVTVTVKPTPDSPATTLAPNYCQNQPAAALVATASMGGTLNWYGPNQTGGVASTSATVPNTSQAGPTTYYVSQTLNGCESPRAAITVTVNSIPDSPSVSPVSFCQNSTAGQLSAIPSPGGILNWYGTAATGGMASATAPTPPTSATGSTMYYVSQSINGCEGPRTSLVVTIKSLPAIPVGNTPAPYCQGSGATPLSATGAGLLWYGPNQTGGTGLATPTVPNTSTPGSTTYYVTQTVDGCESARVGIVVTVKPKPGLPVTEAVDFCQASAPPVLTATLMANATPNWYGTNPTSGTATATAPVPANTAPGTTVYYVSQTLDGCEGDRASLPVRVKAIPAVPGVTAIGFCNNSPASPLTASGVNLKWYDAADKLLGDAPTPGTGAVGDQVFKVSQTVEGCEGPKASLTVTIKPIPAAPIGNTPAPYCQGVTASPLSATGVGLKWYGINQTGGTGDAVAPIPTTGTPGNTTYYVTQTVNGCESSRASITIMVKPKPGLPGTAAVDFCQGATPPALTAILLASATPNWYGTNPTSGTATTTAPVPVNAAPGTTVYYISQTLDGCESERASLPVRVKTLPAVPGVAAIGFCNNSPASQLTASGANLRWYDTSDNFLSGGAPTPNTSTVGDQIFKVSQTVEGCEGPKASITVTIKPKPNAPGVANLNYCLQTQDQPAQNVGALTAAGTSLKWYNADGSSLPNAPIPSVSQVGSQTFKVSQTVDNCEGPQATLQVTVGNTAVPTVANSRPSYCAQDQARPLEATAEAGASLRWITLSSTVSATAPTPPTTTAGDQAYAVYQISQNGCYSARALITVTVKPLPSPPIVSATSFCNNAPSSQLTANGSALKWYDASDKLLGGAPTPGTGTVGDQVYKVSQTVNSCEGPKANLVVTIKPLPAPPPVTNLAYCLQTQDQPAQNVAPLNAFGENLKWYNADNSFTTVAPTPTISQTGVQSYTVSQTYNGCEGGKSTLLVAVRTTAAPTVAKPLVTYCISDKAVPLEATGETGGSLRWINPYNVVSNEAPTPYTLNTSIQAGGDPFYVYQIGQNGCYSERSVTKVLVNTSPTLALITPVSSVNLGQRVALQLKFTSVPPYSYTLTDGYSGVANKADTTIFVLPRASTTYQVITVRNSCGVGLPGNPATAAITVRVPTVTTSALTTATLCAGTSLAVPFTTTGEFNTGNLFRIELVSVADTAKKYVVPATASASPITAPVPLTLVGGQYYVRVKADNPEIAIVGSNSPTLLTVRPQPTATLTGTQNIYEGFPANLTLTFGGESPWTVTVADSVRSYSATTTTNPYLLEVRPSRSNTYQLVSVTNSCGNGPVSGTATVSVLPLLGTVDNDLGPLVKTYPLPTTSILTVELDLVLTRDPATLLLTDMSGKPVLQQTTRNRKQELDLTAQPDGLYLLRIQVGDRQTVRKVLKQ